MPPPTPAAPAHELSDMLTVIAGYTDLVLGRLPAGDPGRTLLENVRRAADRSVALARQLVTQHGRQGLNPAHPA